MNSVSFKISPLLREAAELKIEELDRAKQAFKRRYTNNKDPGRAATREKLLSLVDDIRTLDPHLEDEDELSTILRYIGQSDEDESISESTLLGFEQQLHRKITQHLNRLGTSSLHAELLKQAMADGSTTDTIADQSKTEEFDEDFEIVGIEDTELIKEDIEDRATTVKEVDVSLVEQYLSSLMEFNGDTKALEEFRDDMQRFANRMIERRINVEQDEMMWWILDLLNDDLISDEKKETLKGYLLSPMVITELVSILNLKSIREWNWKNAMNGRLVRVPVRRDKRLYVPEDGDIIDILFLHGVATRWAAKLKEKLEGFIHKTKHTRNRHLAGIESNKKPVFLTEAPLEPPPHPPVGCEYLSSFPQSSHKKSKGPRHLFGCATVPKSTPPPPSSYIDTIDTIGDERHKVYMRDFFMSRLPFMEGCIPKRKRTETVQANLIKTLAAEFKLCEVFEGKVYTYVIEFEDRALEVLPHSIVLTVLKFLGVPDVFIDFFKRFLQEKLNIGPGRVVTRAAGIPEHHEAMHSFFTEAIFFFLELAVFKRTGVYLYRIHETCYFVGTAEQGQQVEEEINRFESIMMLFFTGFPGNLNIGALRMKCPPSLTSTFAISQNLLEIFASRTRYDLERCTTILEWIRVWNSTAGTYAAHLFGPLANVLGSTHLAAVKAAYKRIFALIFPHGNLTTHVTQMLHSHLPHLCTDAQPLEPLIYLPHAYGGLGVKNPFATLALARDIYADPDAIVAQHVATDPTSRPSLTETYNVLLAEPVTPIALGTRVTDEVERLSGRGDMRTEARTSAEELWVLRLYASACFERFGGLEVWCSEWVPMEALRGVRGVGWDEGEEEEDEEEEGSVGSEE
jgi:hypothetical protein